MPSTARVAIVTGASQGLGASIALRLADDGLDVAVNDIESKSDQLQKIVAQIQAKGRRALAVPGDVSRDADVQAMVAKVVEKLGGLDVVRGSSQLLELSLSGRWIDALVNRWSPMQGSQSSNQSLTVSDYTSSGDGRSYLVVSCLQLNRINGTASCQLTCEA